MSSSNMLYPKEDKENNILMYACRTCQFSEPAISSCVFRNQLYNTVGETAGVTQDVGADPTVGDPNSDYFACTLCGEELVCETCGGSDCFLIVGPSLNSTESQINEEMMKLDVEEEAADNNDTAQEEDSERMHLN